MPDTDLPEPLADDPRGVENSRFRVSDPDHWIGAVLLADEIRYYCQQEPQMIDPFDIDQLRPASYNLKLGEQIRIGGKDGTLDASKPTILEPHQVAILSTEETLNIPRFLIARWGIKVRKIYEGVLWTGGVQVDPGWQGKLFCPMYNLSERQISLKRGIPFFTIDFVRTTAISPQLVGMRDDEELIKIWRIPFGSEPRMEEYDINRIHSAPYEALREVEETRQFRQTYLVGLGLLFAAIAAVVAALAIFTVLVPTTPEPNVTLGNPWFAASMAAALAALILSAVACYFTYSTRTEIAKTRAGSPRSTPIADIFWELITLPLVIGWRLVTWFPIRVWHWLFSRNH